MNKKNRLNSRFYLIILSLALLGYGHAALADQTYENGVILKSSSILPEKVLKSKVYVIDQTVHNDGFTNTYSVYSNNGNYKVRTNIGLFKLLTEIEAIEAMKRVEESDVFIQSFKESGAATVEGVKNLFSDPEKTLSNAATGLNSLFNRAEESVFHSSPGETEDSRAEQTIGFSNTKRQVAYRYHVDVYSQNQILQGYLDRIAWAEYAGGLSLGVATMPIGGLAGATLTVSGTARILGEAVATLPPAELKLQNRKKLKQIGINKELADIFIENPHFSPLQQTAFVMALETVKARANRSLPIHVALRALNQESAAILTAVMVMQSGYNKHTAPIVGFKSLARMFCAEDSAGKTIVMLPADHITWNKRVAYGARSIKVDKGAELWITGTVSERARNSFEDRGWKVIENAAEKIGVTFK